MKRQVVRREWKQREFALSVCPDPLSDSYLRLSFGPSKWRGGSDFESCQTAPWINILKYTRGQGTLFPHTLSHWWIRPRDPLRLPDKLIYVAERMVKDGVGESAE